jgi:hypothetical protein
MNRVWGTIAGLYLIISFLLGVAVFIKTHTLYGFFVEFFLNMFILMVFCFWIISGLYFLYNKEKLISYSLLLIALSTQLLQITFLGFTFSFVSGIYWGIGFIDRSENVFINKIELLRIWVSIGYKKEYQMSLIINLFVLFLFILVYYESWKNQVTGKKNYSIYFYN